MQVLVALAQARDAVVSRDDLIARCWEGRIVGEDAINRAIGRLRRLSEATGSFTIETIARVGYRLRAPSPGVAAPPAPAAASAAPESRPGLPRYQIWLVIGGILLTVALIWAGAAIWWLSRPVQWALDDFRMVIATPLFENDPALAPNGTMIAYSAGPVPFAWHIYVRNLSDGQPIQLTNGPNDDDMRPAWSPDSSRIAFIRHHENQPCVLVIKPVPAGDEHIAGHCKQDDFGSLSWAPDGTALYYADRPAARVARRIMRLDLESGETRALTAPSNDLAGDRDPVPSPDGTKLTFARTTKGATQQFVLDMTTGALQLLPRIASAFPNKAWIDNDSLITASGGSRQPALWIIPLKGEPWRLAVNSQELGRISAGPDHTFAVETSRDQIVLASPPQKDGDPPVVDNPTTGESILPEYARDGQLAYAHINPGGLFEIWVQPPGGTAHQASTINAFFLNGLRWSPDGKRLAFFGLIGQGHGIYVINADGTGLQHVAGQGTLGIAAWTADGRGLLYPMKSSEGWRLWRTSLEPGARPEPFGEIGWFAIRTVGDAIYGLSMNREGVWRLDGTPRFVANLKRRCTEAFVECNAWLISGDDLVLADHTERARPRVFFHSLKDGTERSVVAPGLSTSDEVAVDPLSGKLLYVYEGLGDSDIALFHLSRR
jgi:Tol biopolymer transport system component